MLLKLAFRNIWRNRRRTFITAASILFAVFFAAVMRSVQEGTWDYMIDSVVRYHVGYGQIHEKGYWDERSINKLIPADSSMLGRIESAEAVVSAFPRIEHFALASVGTNTRGVMVVGMDPQREDAFADLTGRIQAGAYLKQDDTGVLLGNGLSKRMGLGVGDSLVLVSQGYRGANAVGIYPVRGVIHFGIPDLSNRMVYMSLHEAQHFFGAYELASAIVIDAGTKNHVPAAVAALSAELDSAAYEVMGYQDMMPELLEAKEFDVAGSYVIMLVLYLIIAFGIFGTLLMMLKEREYEFGVLKAIGMRSAQLYGMVWLESIFLGLIGCLAGAVVALPVIAWLAANPIPLGGGMEAAYEQFGMEPVIVTVVDPSLLFGQMVVVMLIVSVLSLYPLFKIARLRPVEAMRA